MSTPKPNKNIKKGKVVFTILLAEPKSQLHKPKGTTLYTITVSSKNQQTQYWNVRKMAEEIYKKDTTQKIVMIVADRELSLIQQIF